MGEDVLDWLRVSELLGVPLLLPVPVVDCVKLWLFVSLAVPDRVSLPVAVCVIVIVPLELLL